MKKLFLFILLGAVAVSGNAKKKRIAITSTGENLQALTQVTDNEYPCITPFGGNDGKNLYFAVNEDGKYYNIYMKENAFSAAVIQKTSGKNRNYSPTYCPATDKISFKCQNEGMSTSDIFMMSNSKGKALSQITETSNAYEGNPCFTKDGNIIIYDKQSYSAIKRITLWGSILGIDESVIAEKSEIWMKNLKTGENILLGSGYQPQISPDGKKIAYVKYSGDARSCSIWTMNMDGSEPVQITDSKKGYAFYPRWSPDGKKIIFQATKKDKKDADIYVIDTDGNNLTQLTTNTSHDGTPYWTTDGYVYFVSDRGCEKGNYQIWRFKISLE